MCWLTEAKENDVHLLIITPGTPSKRCTSNRMKGSHASHSYGQNDLVQWILTALWHCIKKITLAHCTGLGLNHVHWLARTHQTMDTFLGDPGFPQSWSTCVTSQQCFSSLCLLCSLRLCLLVLLLHCKILSICLHLQSLTQRKDFGCDFEKERRQRKKAEHQPSPFVFISQQKTQRVVMGITML